MRVLSIPACAGAMVAVVAWILSVGCRPASEPPPAPDSGAATSSTASSGTPVSQEDRPRGQAATLTREDILLKGQLETDGEAVVGEHLVLWIPRGAIPREEAGKLLDELQQGIVAAKKKVGRPDWNRQGDRRVYFYLPDAQFVSHASDGNCAFIPLWRVQERKAPWLHEALHLLLKSDQGNWRARDPQETGQRIPQWLFEGLADALAIEISLAEGLEHYSPLYDVPVDQLDALAARKLREAPSPEVLTVIGGRGRLPELFGPQRAKFAVPFYSGSTSFVRFIAKRHGYPPLLAAINAFGHENATLEQETGESLDSMKAAWLEQIEY